MRTKWRCCLATTLRNCRGPSVRCPRYPRDHYQTVRPIGRSRPGCLRTERLDRSPARSGVRNCRERSGQRTRPSVAPQCRNSFGTPPPGTQPTSISSRSPVHGKEAEGAASCIRDSICIRHAARVAGDAALRTLGSAICACDSRVLGQLCQDWRSQWRQAS
jgi:hypothetical protein